MEFGFWIPRPGGWLINGWDEHQQSTEETQLRRKRAQALAETRWAGHEATDRRRAGTEVPGEQEGRSQWRGRRHNDRTLYVVTWEAEGIVKIGFTDHLQQAP